MAGSTFLLAEPREIITTLLKNWKAFVRVEAQGPEAGDLIETPCGEHLTALEGLYMGKLHKHPVAGPRAVRRRTRLFTIRFNRDGLAL